MPSIISSQALPAALSLRVVTTTDCGAEEKRLASPLEAHDDHTWDAASPTSDDDRSAAIPTTADLEPLDDDACATIQCALHKLTTHDDWLQQHEAITLLRRAVVHHAVLLSDDTHIPTLVHALIRASDSLRSALSKNALLALGECCTCLGLARLDSFLIPLRSGLATVPLVDVLLRRATCEKKFLRDAACDAVQSLLLHLASPPLIAAVAPYAASKNAKIVAVASRLMAQSLTQLHAHKTFDPDDFPTHVYEALAKCRAGKDSGARAESLASLRLLGEALGRDRFETMLCSQPCHTVTAILAEVFPPVADTSTTSATRGRRGSLKDRMLQQ